MTSIGYLLANFNQHRLVGVGLLIDHDLDDITATDNNRETVDRNLTYCLIIDHA